MAAEALVTTVASALRAAMADGLDRTDAFALLGHVLGQPRAWLIAHDDAPLSADQALAFAALCRRRAAGEPVAYLRGEQEFFGLTLAVSPAVLIPRPDTETLVQWALDLRAEHPLLAHQPVVDLGTGSGAIALALAAQGFAQVHASDRSVAALAVARRNAQVLKLAVQWHEGSWWQAFGSGHRFALALSNPPYIAPGDAHLPALAHEPSGALVAPQAGLADLRALIVGASAHLLPGAWLLLEHGWDQAEAVQADLRAAGFAEVASRVDAAGVRRCSGGCWLG